MQIALYVIGGAAVVLSLLPLLHRVFNSGCAVQILAGAALIFIGFRWDSLTFFQQKYLASLILLVLVIYCYFYNKIVSEGRGQTSNKSTLIVLGCRIRGDVPSLALEKRIDCAFAYLMENPDSVAVLSGGQGEDENLTEAQCMYNHLTNRGIDKSRLFLEERSVNTDENICFSLKIIEDNGLSKDVAIATSEYHQLRTKMICERYGLSASPYSSKTHPMILQVFVNREMLAIVKEKLMPNLKVKL